MAYFLMVVSGKRRKRDSSIGKSGVSISSMRAVKHCIFVREFKTLRGKNVSIK
jgi:hypothetical protein